MRWGLRERKGWMNYLLNPFNCPLFEWDDHCWTEEQSKEEKRRENEEYLSDGLYHHALLMFVMYRNSNPIWDHPFIHVPILCALAVLRTVFDLWNSHWNCQVIEGITIDQRISRAESKQMKVPLNNSNLFALSENRTQTKVLFSKQKMWKGILWKVSSSLLYKSLKREIFFVPFFDGSKRKRKPSVSFQFLRHSSSFPMIGWPLFSFPWKKDGILLPSFCSSHQENSSLQWMIVVVLHSIEENWSNYLYKPYKFYLQNWKRCERSHCLRNFMKSYSTGSELLNNPWKGVSLIRRSLIPCVCSSLWFFRPHSMFHLPDCPYSPLFILILISLSGFLPKKWRLSEEEGWEEGGEERRRSHVGKGWHIDVNG